jgi:uncharacterized protein YbjT (DUF2867 family)
MRILVTGASGFIGSTIVAALLQAGHQVICGVRDVARATQQFPACEILYCDFNQDVDAAIWRPRLQGIDAVVNCVGILQQRRGESITAIHQLTPCALFDACKAVGVRRVIHLSALGADQAAGTPYALTKQAAENYLTQLDIDSVILRPSLVYGAASHGGTSLFRALAALPGLIPVIGKGEQSFQPIHIEDLAQAICRLLIYPKSLHKKLAAVGPEAINFRQVLQSLRRWLGFKPAKIISIPYWWMKCLAKFGDWFGAGPINSTALAMLHYGNVAPREDFDDFVATIGFTPRGFSTELNTVPSYAQDRWHARLYFFAPLLRVSLGLLWVGSGIVSLLGDRAASYQLLGQLHLLGSIATVILYGAAILDIVLGLLTLLNWKIITVGILQFCIIIFYTLICTINFPAMWLDPFAPLLKNIPILVATLIMLVLAEKN